MQLKPLLVAGVAVWAVACGSGSLTAPMPLQTSESPSPAPAPTPAPVPEPIPAPIPPLQAVPNQITGVVLDALGRPLAGAVVSLFVGPSADTDADGRFTLPTSRPLASTFGMVARKENYGYWRGFVTGPPVVITLEIGYRDELSGLFW